MIATLSAKPVRMSHHQQLYSNTSAGPLPILPRRTSSSRQVPAPSLPMANPGPSTTRRSSSASSGSDTASGSSGPQLGIRARRARSAQAQGHFPPELVNPIPPLSRPHVEPIVIPGGLRASKTEDNITTLSSKKAVSHFIYSPGMSLRGLGLESRSPASTITSAPGRPNDGSGLIRKKSGQLVKPSLKTSRSASGGEGLSMFSKSEPTTPVCKAVHFDSQLEHVKLFLSEQKPLAVSRDGSPTDDTSGTDSDFSSFIFGIDERRDRMKLVIRVVNMPSRINMRADVCLEELSAAPGNTAIIGRVRVRNIAFSKTVAVRFTFDHWQTTSEVVGHYHDSPSKDIDRFFFTIRLDDLLARIEEKTLILAVRYTVSGKDYWDNNSGQNYVAKFSRSTPRDRSLSDEESPENLVSLQNKLEKVVQGNDRSGPATSAQPAPSSPNSSPEPEEAAFKSTSSFAARYDFNASFKNPWKFNDDPPPSHQRNNSYPQFAKASKPAATKTIPALGSPRDLAEGVIPDASASAHTDDVPFEVRNREHSGRNHHRGYFDLSTFGSANVRRTPPTSPRSRSPEVLSPTAGITSSPFNGFYSFPTMETGKSNMSPELPPHRPPPLISGLFSSDIGFESELSTPSLTTPNSSRSTTPSPTEQFLSLPPMSDDDSPQNNGTHYRDLINQYCFFTGGTPTGQDNSSFTFSFPKSLKEVPAPDALGPDSTPKPHSDAQMMSPSPLSTPTSCPSLDDLISIASGSVTPTPSRLNLHVDSRSPTPTVTA